MSKKNLIVTWNHEGGCIHKAAVVNGDPFFSGEPPSHNLIGKAVDLVSEIFDSKNGGSSIQKLAERLAESPYDGKKLAQSAFVCGQAIAEINKDVAKGIKSSISNSGFNKKTEALEAFQQEIFEYKKDKTIAAISIMVVYGVFFGTPTEKDKNEEDPLIKRVEELLHLLKDIKKKKNDDN